MGSGGGGGGMWVQVGGGGYVGLGGGGGSYSGGGVQVGRGLFRWGVQWGGSLGEGSKGTKVRGIEGEQRGKRWGGGGSSTDLVYGQAVHSLCKVSASIT